MSQSSDAGTPMERATAGGNGNTGPSRSRAGRLLLVLLGGAAIVLVATVGVILAAARRPAGTAAGRVGHHTMGGHRAGGADEASPPTSAEGAGEAKGLAALCDRRFGHEDAGVQVLAILPVQVGCKDALGLYAIEAARRHPAQISVVVHDMTGEKGREAMAACGRKCAAILINGKSRFEFDDGAKVLLEGASMESPLDLRRALAAELAAVYGDEAPDLPPVFVASGAGHGP